MEEVPLGAGGRLPYPHTRNDCDQCREVDADFEILEGAAVPSTRDRRPPRLCQGCIGLWMAMQVMSRPSDVPTGDPLAVTVVLLAPGGGEW
ncbi:hypothetical protein ACFOY4_01780 [Actinomadura syzygii]|uniref:Uncharacterized protein n=1 Tax=Actinomadura syzygii TaxID=1427538 RepID=A0A5D0TQF5_9ACTN|nr:hypothetical protein [Actinomadura syzygii]TYC08531.1 hypothetical protein FXF65_37165 [Actinomadura syzygii]